MLDSHIVASYVGRSDADAVGDDQIIVEVVHLPSCTPRHPRVFGSVNIGEYLLITEDSDQSSRIAKRSV